MSKETLQWLEDNTLIGFTEKRGNAWHYRAGSNNHYEGAIPVADVESRLFNWSPVVVPFAGEVGEEYWPFAGKVAVFRSDNRQGLGVFGEDYPNTDYKQRLIEPVANIVDQSQGELACASAGLLQGGAVAWFQIEMPETVETPAGFNIRPFLLATSSLNGKVSTTFKVGMTAVVCDNTLAMALSELDSLTFKVKNTKNSPLRLGEARSALDIVFTVGDEWAKEIERLTNTTVSDEQWDKFLDDYAPLPDPENKRGYTIKEKERDALTLLWNKDERVTPWHGTALGVLQAGNTYNQHEARVNKRDGQEVSKAEQNFENFLMGKTEEQDNKIMTSLNRALVAA